MDKWQERLVQVTNKIEPRPDEVSAIYQRIRRRHQHRRLRAGVFGIGVVAVLVAGLSLVWAPLSQRSNQPNSASTPTTFHVAGRVIATAARGADLWILTCSPQCSQQSGGQLERLDSATGRIGANVSLQAPSSLAVDETGVWVISTEDSTVTHLDESGAVLSVTNLELSTPMGSGDTAFLPEAIAVGEGGVWVASDRGELAHLDPADGSIVAYTPLPADALGGNVVAEFGSVWVAESLELTQLDPTNGNTLSTISINQGGFTLSPTEVVAANDLLWVSGIWAQPVSDGSGPGLELTDKSGLASIDPMTGRVIQTWDTVAKGHLVGGDRSVWIVGSRGVTLRPSENGGLTRVSILSGRVVAVGSGWTWAITGHDLVAAVRNR